MVEKVFVYGDEFGTSHLNTMVQGNTSHFLYASLVIKETDLLKAYDVQHYISEKYFSGGKIKSGSKALRDKNFARRIEILKYITEELDFEVHTIVADKNKIKSKGLEFKEVFYKYFQRIFVSNLINEYERFEVFAHRIISTEFEKEVYAYLESRLNTNSLFSNYQMVDDKDESLVQLADLIVGSLGRVYTTSHYHPRATEIVEILFSKMHPPHFFPYKNETGKTPIQNTNKINDEIHNWVFKDVADFVENPSKDEIYKDLLKILAFMNKSFPFRMIETYEILERMQLYYKSLTKDQLRLLIRDLRNEGIMVVSALGKSGYKLACNESDLINYFNHYLKYVLPMLKKVEVADQKIRDSSAGEKSLLDQPDFKTLKHLIGVVNKY